MGLTGFNLRRRQIALAKEKSVETKEPIKQSAQVVKTEKPVVKDNLTTEKTVVEEKSTIEKTVGRKRK